MENYEILKNLVEFDTIKDKENDKLVNQDTVEFIDGWNFEPHKFVIQIKFAFMMIKKLKSY